MSFLYCQKGFLISSLEDLRNVTVLQHRFLHSYKSTLKELKTNYTYADVLNGIRGSLWSKIIMNMLDFANVDKHQNTSVCCVRLQLSGLSFRAFFPPYNIWCSEVLLYQNNCIYTVSPLADSQWICNPKFGAAYMNTHHWAVCFSLDWAFVSVGRAQHVALVLLTWSHTRSRCWEPRAFSLLVVWAKGFSASC